ncbi:FANCM protein, partial [Emberiza fucata]|nr:FANCM protein [Emberiza fucata]
MRAVYLSSVRSPALGSRYKMVHRQFNPSAIFSQIPEQDTTYAEDSFCVEDEEEEAPSGGSEEEECVDFALLTREGSSSSRQQYLTRRRRSLGQAPWAGNAPAPLQKKKPSRIVVLSDSSEEEMGASRKKPLEAGQGKGQLPKALPSAPSAQPRSGAGEATAPQDGRQDTERLLGLEASMSGMLDPAPEQPGRSTSMAPAGSGCRNTDLQAAAEVSSSLKNHGSSSGSACPAVPNPSSATARISSVPGEHSPSPAGISRVPGEHSPSPAGIPRVPSEHSRSLCILADSREICSGPEVLSCLRAGHGLRVQVCSLGSSDYIVSNRLAVDRVLQSELQSPGNRNKLSQRLQRLQGIFERICVIVETDRVRPG